MALEERIKEIEEMGNSILPFTCGLTRRDREEKEELMLEGVRKVDLIEIIQELQTKNKELEDKLKELNNDK